MDTIGRILGGKNRETPMMRGIKASLVVEKFNTLMKKEWGDQIEKEVNALSLKEKTLTVACMSAAVASEISLNQKRFIATINGEFGAETIERLKIML